MAAAAKPSAVDSKSGDTKQQATSAAPVEYAKWSYGWWVHVGPTVDDYNASQKRLLEIAMAYRAAGATFLVKVEFTKPGELRYGERYYHLTHPDSMKIACCICGSQSALGYSSNYPARPLLCTECIYREMDHVRVVEQYESKHNCQPNPVNAPIPEWGKGLDVL